MGVGLRVVVIILVVLGFVLVFCEVGSVFFLVAVRIVLFIVSNEEADFGIWRRGNS